MKMFAGLYNKIMLWSKHAHAPYYLFALSFAESSFFPIPPDFMLAPMVLANRQKGWWYAFITTLSSVLGALLGYAIGVFFLKLIYPLIIHFGYADVYQKVSLWFEHYNFWVMIFAGFAIIPYKIFTIAAGATHISLIPFIIGSIIGRGGRFYLVTALILWKGDKVENMLTHYIEHIGWFLLTLIVLFMCIKLSH